MTDAQMAYCIIGELLEKPEYRFADPKLLTSVVWDTVKRYTEIELEKEV